MRDLAKIIGQKYNTTVVLKVQNEFPLVVSSDHLCEALKRLKLSVRDYPIERMGSDDFSEFSSLVPGCYFMYFIGFQKNQSSHCDKLDFNDACIDPASELWFNIISDRQGVLTVPFENLGRRRVTPGVITNIPKQIL